MKGQKSSAAEMRAKGGVSDGGEKRAPRPREGERIRGASNDIIRQRAMTETPGAAPQASRKLKERGGMAPKLGQAQHEN